MAYFRSIEYRKSLRNFASKVQSRIIRINVNHTANQVKNSFIINIFIDKLHRSFSRNAIKIWFGIKSNNIPMLCLLHQAITSLRRNLSWSLNVALDGICLLFGTLMLTSNQIIWFMCFCLYLKVHYYLRLFNSTCVSYFGRVFAKLILCSNCSVCRNFRPAITEQIKGN